MRASEKDLARLRGEFGRGERAGARYSRAQSQVEKQTRRTGQSFLQAHAHHVRYLTSLAGGAALIQFARASNRAGLALEQSEQRFAAAADSSAAAASEMAFFRAEAERLKLDIEALQRPYSGFLVALKDTALEGQPARDIFTAIGTSARVLSLSGEDLRGVFTALEQIVSKGTVSAEELRGQLGERLPGAFQAAARAMGVTEGALDDMLRKGELAAVDLLPKLAEELNRTFGDDLDAALDSNVAHLAEFNNEALLLREAIANAGLLDLEANLKLGLIPVMRELSDHMDVLAAGVTGAGAAGATAFALWIGAAIRAAAAARGFSAASAVLTIHAAAAVGAAGKLHPQARLVGQALGVAAVGARGLAIALAPLAGPAGLILAVGLATAGLAHRARNARPELIDLADGVDAYRESLGRLGRAELLRERDALLGDIESAAREAEEIGDLLARGSGPGAHAVPFRADQIEILEARRADALDAMRAQADEFAEVQRRIAEVAAGAGGESGAPAGAAGDTDAEGLGGQARAILDSLVPPADAVRRRIATLYAERDRLLASSAGHSADEVNELSRGIVALQRQLEDLEAAPDAPDPTGDIEARLDRTRAATLAGIEETYRRERFLIVQKHGENSELALAIEREYLDRVAEIRAAAADEAEQAARDRAEAERQSGIPELGRLRAEYAELADVRDFSREALERHNLASERERELQRTYPLASAETLQALREELTARDELSQVIEAKIGIVERYNRALADQAIQEQAIDELRASGDLSPDQADAALADLRILAGEGSFADGVISEFQRIREEGRNTASDLGASFAGLLGPDGQLIQGFSRAAAEAALFGGSATDSVKAVARSVATNLLSQIIAAGVQWLLLQTVFRASRVTAATAELASVTAQTQATSFLAAQNAFAATAAIPVVGPALAPAAAATALATAQALGFGAVTATATKVGASAFRQGGIFDDPVMFGFGRERQIGIAGEAGPEAILPLARGADGNLGVRAAGA